MSKFADTVVSGFKSGKFMHFVLFSILFWGCMLYVFSSVLGFNTIMIAPDFHRHYSVFAREQWIEQILGGKAGVVPWSITRFIGHPLFWQELFFMFSCYAGALGVAYYLKTQKLKDMPAYGGGLFFGFAGYSLTLLSAGHGGYFYMIMFVLFSFGLVNRCFSERKLFHFAFLGVTLMWAEVEQADIWLLFVFLLAAYVVWRSFLAWKKSRSFDFILKVYPRFILTAVFALAVGGAQIKLAFTSTIANREAQMASAKAAKPDAAGSEETNDGKTDAENTSEKNDEWIFSTNWSLPPEDIIEFAVPGIFGNESMRPPYPYWGRLGRPHDSIFKKGYMMPNYRQHTVYLGIVPLLFAFYAFFSWVMAKKRNPSAVEESGDEVFDDVPFWAGAWLVCLFFAMGRYTPFYKLAYNLPFLHYMRCPVKFHHLVETANACLAGFGLCYLLKHDTSSLKTKRFFMYFTIAFSILLIAGALYVKSSSAAVSAYIQSIGLGQAADQLSKYTYINLWRSAFLAVVLSAVFYIASKQKRTARILAVCALICITAGTVDLASVARRYVVPTDVGPHNLSNPVVDAMLEVTGGLPANIMNYIGGGNGDQDWFSTSMRTHGFTVVSPDPSDPENVYSKCFSKYSANPMLHWQVTGSRFVILPRKNAEQLIRNGALRAVCDFEITRGGKVRTGMPSANSIVLAETKGSSLPAVYREWKGMVPAEKQFENASGAMPHLPMTDAPPPAVSGAGRGSSAVSFGTMRQTKHSLRTEGTVSVEGESLIVFNEPASGEYDVFVDGAEVPVYTADGLWASAVVPAGSHNVMLRIHRDPLLTYVSIAASCIALAWGAFLLPGSCFRNHQRQ